MIERCWEVVTPLVRVGGYGLEPPDEIVDVVFVMAQTQTQAKVEGVHALRRLYPHGWVSEGGNPFAGLDAHLLSSCPHGWPGVGEPVRDGADVLAPPCAVCDALDDELEMA